MGHLVVQEASTMIERLKNPGGWVGRLTLISAGLLTVAGLIAVFISSTIWAETQFEHVLFLVIGLSIFAGPIGLLKQPEHPVAGGVLAVVGSGLALPFFFWTVLPFLVLPITIYVSVVRAKAFRRTLSPT
jgi:hypothetical protein